MKIALSTFLTVYLVFSYINASADNIWVPQKIEPIMTEHSPGHYLSSGSLITFNNNIQLKTDLIDIEYIGQLVTNSDIPFLILAARNCDACDMNTSIYIVQASDVSLKNAGQGPRNTYPRQLTEFGPQGQLYYKSRFFWGDCLESHKQVAVWFIESKNDKGKWSPSVFVAKPTGFETSTHFLEQPLPNIDDTINLVQSGHCKELPGVAMTDEP